MSDVIDKIDFIKIEAPSLDSANYGDNIKECFENINNNFDKISNTDFLKGKQGDSVILKSYDLSQSDNKNIIEAIKKAISNEHKLTEADSISYTNDKGELITVNWYDNLDKNPGFLYINEAILNEYDEGIKPVSSLPYIYRDPRFEFAVYNYAKETDYSNISDFSCVLYFKGVDNNNNMLFTVMDIFPTLYFDNVQNAFCWKIWGNKTGLIANGPAGKNGDPGYMAVVCRNVDDRIQGSDSIYKIRKVFKNGEPVDINEDEIKKMNGNPAVVFYDSYSESDKSNENLYWISTIISATDNSYATVTCTDRNKVQSKYRDSDLFNSMLNMKTTNSDLPAYVVPAEDPVGGDVAGFVMYNKNSGHPNLIVEYVNSVKDIGEDNTPNTNNKLNIKLPVTIGLDEYNISIDSTGIYFTLDSKKYKLGVGEGNAATLTSV